LKFKSAHVVKKRNGRSKGFGFVEFEAEEDQKKALQAINNKSIDGRELIVKVALTERSGQTESKDEKK
jgi:RNA recognition motif-containing protein